MNAAVHFHNTTRLSGAELREAVLAAEKQDDAVLAIFRNARGPLSPSDVWGQVQQAGKAWPLTSIRRAITNLTDDGALARLDLQKPGIYGKPEHLWSVAGFQQDLFGVRA